METLTLTKLALISKRACREPKFQFTSLTHLLDEGFLAACYVRLGRDRASGIDGVTWRAYGERLPENLRDFGVPPEAEELQAATFKAGLYTQRQAIETSPWPTCTGR